MDAKTIAVIGAGTMGNGIAQVLAAGGLEVVMTDIDDAALQRGVNAVTKSLDRLLSKQKISEGDRKAILGRIKTATKLDAVADCDVVVEAATENVDLKLRIFADLDRIAKPAAILASNTSSISLTRIAGATKRPAQVIGMHFFNPVPMMQLVELIRALQTSDATFETVKALTQKVGKTPVEVKNSPGFVANRILLPMLNEAVFCLYEGLAKRRGHRHRDEARHGAPDGAAGAGRSDRARYLPVDSGGAVRRLQGSEVPPLPAVAREGRRRASRPQVRPRFLRLRESVARCAAGSASDNAANGYEGEIT